MPRPKKAFRSPRVQSGREAAARGTVGRHGWLRSARGDGGPGRRQRGEQRRRRRDPAEDAALGGDHPEPHLVELREVGADAVREHEALEAAVVGLADGGVHAHLGRDAGHDEAGRCRGCAGSARGRSRRRRPCRACRARPRPAIGASSSTMSWPSSPRTRMRPFGPSAPIAGVEAAAGELGGRAVGEVGAVALARVDDEHAGRARGGEHGLAAARRRAASRRHVVAEQLAEAARLEEVALHVDDHAARWSAGRTRTGTARPGPPASSAGASKCQVAFSEGVGERPLYTTRCRSLAATLSPAGASSHSGPGCPGLGGAIVRHCGPMRAPRRPDVALRAMSTPLYADRRAVERLAAARPAARRRRPRARGRPPPRRRRRLPRRPADRRRRRCARRCARRSASRSRSRASAPTPAEALALADAGEVAARSPTTTAAASAR